MNYLDNKPVLLGDKVMLSGGMLGVVVVVFDTGQYSPGYEEDEWGYLAEGVLVESPDAGIIHYKDIKSDFTLIQRGC